jgi:O-antigen/teichoic acid export membrane protein
MFDKLKELTKDTAIYGISTIVGRFLNFILVPFYTNIFAPSEYGIIQLIYAYIGILIIVCVYGLDSAFLKYAAFKDVGDDKDNFSTPFISIIITSILFTLVISLNAISIGSALSIPENYFYLIYLAAGLIAADAIGVIPFLKLRLERKAAKFSTIKIINICVNIALNIYLILFLDWGIEAILISNVAASIVSLILLLPTIVGFFRFRFHFLLFKRLLKFGLPYLPGGLAVMVVQVVDVPILEKLTDLKTVGIYKANYKLGIFMMLFVNMFQYAWQPFFLQNAKDPQAKEMFSKVLSYFTLVGSAILVILSLFITDIAQIQVEGYSLIGSKYWAGLHIVPIILLAYLINGMYVIFSAGIYIEEKSIYVPVIAGSGAIVNIIANFLLIPVLNITGAAFATLASYLVMAGGYYFVTQKFYKVKYELKIIGKVFLAVILAGTVFYFLYLSDNLFFYNKLLIFIGYALFIYFIAVDRAEISLIRKKLLESRKR